MEEKIVPYELLEKPDEKLKQVEELIKYLFGESITIFTKDIKKGGASNLIYIPKKYGKGKLATVIVWNKKYVYKDGRIIECNGTNRK